MIQPIVLSAITLGPFIDLWPFLPPSSQVYALHPGNDPVEKNWMIFDDIWAQKLIIFVRLNVLKTSSPQFRGGPTATTLEESDRAEPDPIVQSELTLATSPSVAWNYKGSMRNKNP